MMQIEAIFKIVITKKANTCWMLTLPLLAVLMTMKHCARKLNTSLAGSADRVLCPPTRLSYRQVRAWLKAGVMDSKQLFQHRGYTPQGGSNFRYWQILPSTDGRDT